MQGSIPRPTKASRNQSRLDALVGDQDIGCLQLGVQAAFGPSDTAGNSPFFEQAGGGAVALQVRPVDHHGVRRRALPGQGCEDPVEDTNPAPADETVVKRFLRPADGGRVPPHQPAPDHVNDPEITRWSLTRGTPRGLFGRSGFRRANWASDSQKWWSDIANSLHFAGVNHITGRAEILFMGPKPSCLVPASGGSGPGRIDPALMSRFCRCIFRV
jgi:hypothetical protein